MAVPGACPVNENDAFAELAQYYDAIMEDVDYYRWFRTTEAIARMAPQPFIHLDAACGTGVLIDRLSGPRWKSFGIDLSAAMLRQTRAQGRDVNVANADLRALPFSCTFSLITCLFDSINFLLEEEDLRRAMRQLADALLPGGILYCDAVTERMVLEHFDGQTWTETTGAFETTWSNAYDPKTGINNSRIHVDAGARGTVRERIYSRETLESAMEDAGLVILGVLDAHSWRPPQRRTTRLDLVAIKDPPRRVQQQFEKVCREVRGV